tara:strand:+ start:18332 stop:18526 length:195 start_codon:yes stop_codon:yes gene_type:complete
MMPDRNQETGQNWEAKEEGGIELLRKAEDVITLINEVVWRKDLAVVRFSVCAIAPVHPAPTRAP